MLSAFLNAVILTPAADAAGKMIKTRFSKTKASAHVGVGAGAYALLIPALNGDHEAIGALLVMGASWAWSLFDRWRKDRE